jgi:hypothetical protein
MNIDKRWLLLLVVAAGAAGAAVASNARGRYHRTERKLEHRKALGSWEGEGGNLAPSPVAPAQP